MTELDNIRKKVDLLPKISHLIKTNNITFKKSLGQNFLVDEEVNYRIAKAARVTKDNVVLEIGAGIGALTREIIALNPQKIIIVEKDNAFIPFVESLKDIYNNILIYNQDALSFEEGVIASKIDIIANLPYNIGVALLLKWLEKIEVINSITVMLQDEVVGRIAANVGDDGYGSLSIIMQLYFQVDPLFLVRAESFVPRPKVNSRVVRLTPLNKPRFLHNKIRLEKILKAAFGQRRKMLRQSLKSAFKQPIEALHLCELDPTLRAEQLQIEDFCKLSMLDL